VSAAVRETWWLLGQPSRGKSYEGREVHIIPAQAVGVWHLVVQSYTSRYFDELTIVVC
jgi:hypothetical protein